MSELKKKINYTVVCVNEFANRFNIASSPSYVFGLLQDEINFGHIVQAEV
jgi:hypothetical protein